MKTRDRILETSLALFNGEGEAQTTTIDIANELDIPFRFIGMGEQADDMAPYDAEKFVDALLEISEDQNSTQG